MLHRPGPSDCNKINHRSCIYSTGSKIHEGPLPPTIILHRQRHNLASTRYICGACLCQVELFFSFITRFGNIVLASSTGRPHQSSPSVISAALMSQVSVQILDMSYKYIIGHVCGAFRPKVPTNLWCLTRLVTKPT